ncbi:HAMP domain/GAF domain/GGDEF domain protein [Grimontia indica]|uniref:diguanylate cyclase n=1 Tax=Grimontia indica TaxID=1056512 RepID=R1I8R2_9GAMM|nr:MULTISPECIES: GGDEF domain-containing protein [Grimontia]EOD77091.1 HAMP domain/GAF domain/GGDEF domain protein [Grimontia indica]
MSSHASETEMSVVPTNIVGRIQHLTRRKDLDFSEWVRELLQIATWQFDADCACFSRIDNLELEVVECYSNGNVVSKKAGDVVALGSTFCSVTAGMETPLMAPDTRKNEKLSGHPGVNRLPEAYWGVAIRFGGAVWGTLSVVADADGSANPGNEGILTLLAGILEIKLENEEYRAELNGARESYRQLSERLENLQQVDILTELPSRRALFDYLNRELNQLIRRDGEGAIALVDIDNFHAINEKHGHEEGDRILKGAATALRQAVRNYDYVARYSGEQFLIWLPDTLQSEVVKVCERMSEGVAQCSIDNKPVTISIGYCAFRSDSEKQIPYDRAVDKLINLAHNALSEAKVKGRNCAMSASKRPVTITSITN